MTNEELLNYYEEELLLVRKAIKDILEKGTSYSIAGRSLTRANLSDLYKREKELIGLINMLANESAPIYSANVFLE